MGKKSKTKEYRLCNIYMILSGYIKLNNIVKTPDFDLTIMFYKELVK